MTGDIGWLGAFASLSLVIVAVAISLRNRLDVERSILWAGLRAAVQLVAVGLLFTIIFSSAQAMVWAWAWVVGMTILSAEVVARRAPGIPKVRQFSLLALGGAVAITVGLIFGLGVFDFKPVIVVVIAGITLGNTLPATVQAAQTIKQQLADHPGQVEVLLALGFDKSGATRELSRAAVKNALLPQIERTKVIGLIALPGTMTGMLLAGAEPLNAVLAQLVITYLVLGSVGVAASSIVAMAANRSLTRDLRLADWAKPDR